jgi:hypothetical protein
LFFGPLSAGQGDAVYRKTLFVLFSLFLLSLGTALATWPVNVISISMESGKVIVCGPIPEGWTFTSRIIHSLEKTPVEDEYRVVSGRIWQWEERYQSNNAGLPTEVPENGRFVSAPDWFIIRGGRNHWDALRYRVGNCGLGRNLLALEGFGQIRAFERYPGERLLIEARPEPFAWAARVLCVPDLR